MYLKTAADLEARLDHWIESYYKEKAKWLERLERDPRSAMEWSGAMFEESARYFIAYGFRADLWKRRSEIEAGERSDTDAEMLTLLRQHVFATLMNRVGRVPSSSSVTSNLADQYETKAWRDFLGWFGRAEDMMQKGVY